MELKMITSNNYEENVILAVEPVIINLWANWCSSMSDTVGNRLAELAEEYEGKVLVGKCNVDDNQIVPSQLGIMSIPAVFFFKDGKAVGSSVGYRPKEDLKKIIDSLL